MMSSNGVRLSQCKIPRPPIPIRAHGVNRPSDLSATVRIEVYATFEFQPTLGTGEQLRRLTVTVDQLTDRSAKSVRE